MTRSTTRASVAVITALLAAIGLAACSSDASAKKQTINLVAYSTPQSAYQALEAAFAKTDAGKNVTFNESYAASGDQSRAVEGGHRADYVNFSLDSDLSRLVDAKLVSPDWAKATDTNGYVADSVVVLVVRKGNHKHITGWDDLVKPGVGVVTANPASSGGARWNLLAAYGHVIAQGGTDADAQAYVAKLFKHAVSLTSSGRDALTSFTGGNGDVLISYENEAILARQKGTNVDYVIPPQTLLIQTPAAVTKTAPKAASDFLKFVLSEDGQALFRKYGYRPVVDGLSGKVVGANDPTNPFPTPKVLLTIAKDFGGWSAAKAKFFDENNGIITKIQLATGTDKDK
jgi:sulfate/thiosulfate-binding protein